ncbi:MAG TPA: hypothetical protein VGR37_03510 [Longimicrobiaceae bacterium]|nr:hypothetical protein [Longimicrobiaceae bacterium]
MAGPGGGRLAPEVQRALSEAGAPDGPAVVLETRTEEGEARYVVGQPVAADTAGPESGASSGGPHVLVHPNGGYPGAPSGRQILNRDPTFDGTFTITCIVNGAQQPVKAAVVDSIRERNYGTPVGGHGSRHNYSNESPPGRPLGRWAPAAGPTDGAGVLKSKLTAGNAAGDERLLIWYRITDPDSPCKGMDQASKEFQTRVRVPGLVLIPDDANIAYSNPTSDHPVGTFWYLDPSAVGPTLRFGALHRAELGSPLLLTAAALFQGGINDVSNNWRNPHAEHRLGHEIDLDDQAGDSLQRLNLLERMGKRAGFTRCEMHKGRKPDGRLVYNHVHCSMVSYQ